MMGPEADDDLKCPCCGRENVTLRSNIWLTIALCTACLCTWGDSVANSWEELKEKSLASGDKWFRGQP